jgi:hypothetical protein
MRTSLLLALVVCVYGKWKPDPMPVEGTSQAILDTNPQVLQAKKMAKLMKRQDVVTTCRYMLFKIPKTFHEAKDHCENTEWPITNTGIGMASIQNEAENKDIMSLIRLAFGIRFNNQKPYSYGNWVFIGLSKREDNARKLNKKEKGTWNPDHWYYTDNSKARYEHFRKSMPDQQSKGKGKNVEWQNWVQVNKKGWWDDTFASKSLPFTCQYCGKYIVLSAHVQWDAAKEHCEDFGLKFATVTSAQENQELLFAATVTLGEELGGKRFNNSNWVWIGEEEVLDAEGKGTDEWQHYDGTEWGSFKPHWDRKYQPDNRILEGKREYTEQKVVAVSRKDGKWDDSFKHKRRPFACMCPERACHFT